MAKREQTKGNTTPEPEPTVEPEAEVEPTVEPEVEPTVEPETEDFEQKYKSLKGMYDKTLEEVKTLKGQQGNLTEIRTKVDNVLSLVQSQGEQIGLVTDALGEVVGANEELQERIEKARKAREEKLKFQQHAEQVRGEIFQILEAGKINPNDEKVVEPIVETWQKAKFAEAKDLALKAVSLRVEDLATAPLAEKEAEKPKQKVITKTPVGLDETEGLSGKELIKRAIAKRES